MTVTPDDYPYAAIRELCRVIRQEMLPAELAPIYQQLTDLRERVEVLERTPEMNLVAVRLGEEITRVLASLSMS